VYWYFNQWEQAKATEKILPVVRAQLRVQEGRNPEPSTGLIDSQSVKGADTVGRDTRGYDAPDVSSRCCSGPERARQAVAALPVSACGAQVCRGGDRLAAAHGGPEGPGCAWIQERVGQPAGPVCDRTERLRA
jgi:hypothetical protein